jgi:hypothetical protein
MDTKTASTMGVALLSCIALMLTVIGGLYGYNTFAGGATPVHAQTDRGPNWTVTPVSVDGTKQFIVVVTEDSNPFIDVQRTRQMAVYELSSQRRGTAELFFVAARVLEYDSKMAEFGGQDATRRWGPREVRGQLPDGGRGSND